MGKITVNDREVREMFKELEDMPQYVMEKTYPYLKDRTPVKSGNARSKTRLVNTGWSQQAPGGFTEPAIKEMDNLITDKIRKIGQ